MRVIIEIFRYSRCSPRTRVVCRKLAGKHKIRQSRIYSLVRGRRAKSDTEMKVLYSMMEMGFIKEVRIRYR